MIKTNRNKYLHSLLIALSALLLANPAFAEDSTKPPAERERNVSSMNTGLLSLKERETYTVTLAPVKRSRVPLAVRVRFIDESGRVVAKRKGRIASDAAFVTKLSHDELGRFDSALIRADVRVIAELPVDNDFECPLVGSGQTSDGPVLTWTAAPCQCAGTVPTPWAMDCTSFPIDITGGEG